MPAQFWGVVPQERTTLAQFKRLRRGGIGSVRIGVNWPTIAPEAGVARDWSDVDEVVENATRAGLEVLPYVYGSPRWVARDERTMPVGTVRQRRAWTDFLRELVHRYGPAGRFWANRPKLPERPLRSWQIWNEPNFFYFSRRPSPARYAELVQLSHRALDGVDPEARLILGGMFALPAEDPPRAYPAYSFLAQMYRERPGLRRTVNGVAIHAYTRSYRFLRPILDQVRRTLRRAGAPQVPLYMTEVGWGSLGGKGASQLEKGRAGQARALRGAYRVLLANRGRWRLQRVFWFAATDARRADTCNFCDSAGLFTADFEPKPAWRALTRLIARESG